MYSIQIHPQESTKLDFPPVLGEVGSKPNKNAEFMLDESFTFNGLDVICISWKNTHTNMHYTLFQSF